MTSPSLSITETETQKWFTYALWLAIATILYNILEGLISVYFGSADEALTLLGFGLDSFIETISAVGILSMVIRLKQHGSEQRNDFEKTALKITGWCFYILSLVLAIGAIFNIVEQHTPQTTLPGIIISLISIGSMWLLVYAKRTVGNKLNSGAIISDANCNLVCIYMSLVLLAASFIYQVSGFGWVDSLGAAGLIWFSVSEGKESFEKAHGLSCSCDSCHE